MTQTSNLLVKKNIPLLKFCARFELYRRSQVLKLDLSASISQVAQQALHLYVSECLAGDPKCSREAPHVS